MSGTLFEHAAIGFARSCAGIDPERITVIAPGVIRAENAQNRLILGMPDGRPDTRLEDLASALNPTGIDSTVTMNGKQVTITATGLPGRPNR